jgi:hypothetical protein
LTLFLPYFKAFKVFFLSDGYVLGNNGPLLCVLTLLILPLLLSLAMLQLSSAWAGDSTALEARIISLEARLVALETRLATNEQPPKRRRSWRFQGGLVTEGNSLANQCRP